MHQVKSLVNVTASHPSLQIGEMPPGLEDESDVLEYDAELDDPEVAAVLDRAVRRLDRKWAPKLRQHEQARATARAKSAAPRRIPAPRPAARRPAPRRVTAKRGPPEGDDPEPPPPGEDLLLADPKLGVWVDDLRWGKPRSGRSKFRKTSRKRKQDGGGRP